MLALELARFCGRFMFSVGCRMLLNRRGPLTQELLMAHADQLRLCAATSRG